MAVPKISLKILPLQKYFKNGFSFPLLLSKISQILLVSLVSLMIYDQAKKNITHLGFWKQCEMKEGNGRPCQGLRARASPNLVDELMTFVESYSAENVISEFGLQARWHWKAALPSLVSRVFNTVPGLTVCEVPMANLFSRVENL